MAEAVSAIYQYQAVSGRFSRVLIEKGVTGSSCLNLGQPISSNGSKFGGYDDGLTQGGRKCRR